MRLGCVLVLALAGCCSGPGEATQVAAADTVAGWGLALDYVRDFGRADSPDAQAERRQTLARCAAWGVEAEVILAALTKDKAFDPTERLRIWNARTTATPAAAPGAEGPGPSAAPAGAGGP